MNTIFLPDRRRRSEPRCAAGAGAAGAVPPRLSVKGCVAVSSVAPSSARLIGICASGAHMWRCSGRTNSELVHNLSRAEIVQTTPVRDAMFAVDRGHFLLGTTERVSKSYSYGPYADAPQSIGHGVTISAPHVHAMALEALAGRLIASGSRVLDVGSGSGILLAYLHGLIGEGGMVVGVEVLEPLVCKSIENLRRAGFQFIRADCRAAADATAPCGPAFAPGGGALLVVRAGDGWDGAADLGPFDAIHVGAYASEPPEALVRQLKPGGRMVLPLGTHDRQAIHVIDKSASGELSSRPISGHVRYVPLVHPKPPSCGAADGDVDWDARYRRGWAYGREPNAFVVEVARRFLGYAGTATGGSAGEETEGTCAGLAERSAAGQAERYGAEQTECSAGVRAGARLCGRANGGACGGAAGALGACSAPPLDVLSLGEGQGRNAVFLASLGHSVTAVDASAVGLHKASLLAAERGVPGHRLIALVADLQTYIPPPASCDIIISIFCALPSVARARLHAASVRALRPGGLVVIVAFAPRQATVRGARAAGPPPDRLVSASQLASELEGLDVLVGEEVEAVLSEGRFHRGMAVISRVVARKPEAGDEGGKAHWEVAVTSRIVARKPAAGGEGGVAGGEAGGVVDVSGEGEGEVPSAVVIPQTLVHALACEAAVFDKAVGQASAPSEPGGEGGKPGAEACGAVDDGKGGDGELRRSPVSPHTLVHSSAAEAATSGRAVGQASVLSGPGGAACWRASLDAVFAECAALTLSLSPRQMAAAAARDYVRCQAVEASTAAELDPLLRVAGASVCMSAAVAEGFGWCRYCWMPQTVCLCAALEALGSRFKDSAEESAGCAAVDGPAARATAAAGAAAAAGEPAARRRPLKAGPPCNIGSTFTRQPCSPLGSRSPCLAPVSCSRPQLRWVIVTHPNEFLRARSSAKLACRALGVGSDTCEMLVYGAGAHEARLQHVLRCEGPSCILFPGPKGECLSVAQAVELAVPGGGGSKGAPWPERLEEDGIAVAHAAESETGAGGRATFSADASARASQVPSGEAEGLKQRSPASAPFLTVIVPDGSWEQARALVRALHSRAPHRRLPCVELDPSAVAAHESAYIEALHAGCGRGRLATLEACALFLREAASLVARGGAGIGCGCEMACVGLLAAAERAAAMMEPLISSVEAEALADASGREAPMQRTPRHFGLWVDALRAVATKRAPPLGLRRCAVCAETLSSPLRMQAHLEGRRHCDAVARRFFGCSSADVPPSAAAAEAAFERHSVLPLASTPPDPPDVALMLLHQALAELGETEAACPEGAMEEASPAIAAARHDIPYCAAPEATDQARVEGTVVETADATPGVGTRPAPSLPICGDEASGTPELPCPLLVGLPAHLRREDTLSFCTARHDLRGATIDLLATPRKGIGTFGNARPRILEAFVPHRDVFRRFKARQALYREVGRSARLLDAYEALLAGVVLPHLRSRLGTSEGQRIIFYCQYPPTLRVQPGLSEEHGPVHCDAEYGHQPGEINFWMPLTSYPKTRTSLHVESEPGAGACAAREAEGGGRGW